MNIRACVLLLPVLMFIVSQIVSVAGAFNALNACDPGELEDLSLEDIVYLDPFLGSQIDLPTIYEAPDETPVVESAGTFYVDEIYPDVFLSELPHRLQHTERPGTHDDVGLSFRILLI